MLTERGVARCPHCDTRDCHDVLEGKHPSFHCVDCLRLGTSWDARYPSPPTTRPRNEHRRGWQIQGDHE